MNKIDYSFLGEDYPHKKRLRYVVGGLAVTCAAVALYLIPFTNNYHVTNPTDEAYLRPISLDNASAVFNTVQGALRAKNSQIQPIGVGFIPAYIPEGTLIYHGNTNGRIPDGPEWIALDHEFSYSFVADRANPSGNKTTDTGPGPGKGHGDGSSSSDGPESSNAPAWGPGGGHGPGGHGGGPGGGGHGPGDHGASIEHVSLFTLEVSRPLNRMILFDGSSAAKTDTGEMDQQGILAHIGYDSRVDERSAAKVICDWGKKFGLDGFIRIENGYEGVLCDFHDKLTVLHNTSIEWTNDTLGLPLEIDGELGDDYEDFKKEIKAVAAYDWSKQGNIHDKREGRVLLDFRGLQTPLNKTWISPDTYLRRILNVSEEIKTDIIDGLAHHLSQGADPFAGTDWQLMTSEIVDKFAPHLQMLNRTLGTLANDEESLLNVAKNVTIFTTNFVRRFLDHHHSNDTEIELFYARQSAVEQYAHFLEKPQSDSDILIYSSVYTVTASIVDVMFDSFLVGREVIQAHYTGAETLAPYVDKLTNLQQEMSLLLSTIQWESTFYRCDRQCDWDEICYTPTCGPSPLGWGGASAGMHEENGRNRINEELQCVSYKTILNQRR